MHPTWPMALWRLQMSWRLPCWLDCQSIISRNIHIELQTWNQTYSWERWGDQQSIVFCLDFWREMTLIVNGRGGGGGQGGGGLITWPITIGSYKCTARCCLSQHQNCGMVKLLHQLKTTASNYSIMPNYNLFNRLGFLETVTKAYRSRFKVWSWIPTCFEEMKWIQYTKCQDFIGHFKWRKPVREW